MRLQRPNNNGSSIVESVVAIGLLALFVTVFGASYTIVINNTLLKNKNLAYNVAVEEIEALRNTPYTQLTNRTDADFIEVAYNKGSWLVASLGSSPSSPNILQVGSPVGNPSGVTGLAIVPGFDYSNFTFETDLNVRSDSPAGWQSVIYFRYHDSNNYYRAYFTSTDLYIDKKVDGTETSLGSKTKTFLEDTWYTVKIITSSNTLDVYINDVLELSATDSDSSFAKGRIGLASINSAHQYYDDISVTEGATNAWNFDSDTAGELPSGWERFSVNDLPGGTGLLTIQDDQSGFTDIKKISVKVNWQERGNTYSVELTTLITLTQ
ncbi:DUF1080 domain-containing protein [Patescibacteria group bacterium]|nr:DUF1080 domain-containing protein [Patescibacteria group bacterium]